MKLKTTGSGSMARTETTPASGMNPSLLVPTDDAQSLAHVEPGARGLARRNRRSLSSTSVVGRRNRRSISSELREDDGAHVVRVDRLADLVEDLGLHRVVDREQDHGLLALRGASHFHARDVDAVLTQDRAHLADDARHV